MQGSRGHTLIETLVVVAIIGILMAMYAPALSRAMRAAEKVATTEGMRQQNIGKFADSANGGVRKNPPSRDECRAAYRRNIGPGSGKGRDIVMCEMLYAVSTEAEFRAYWFTLIDPTNTAPLEYTGGALRAYDDEGTEFILSMNGSNVGSSRVPVAWEFLSSVPSESSGGDIGTTVSYQDGHVEYIRYPGEFPACVSVAELSHRYMQAYGH